MEKYRFLPHTADAKFQAFGKTLEESFVNAALAMASLMWDWELIDKTKKQRVEEDGRDLEQLKTVLRSLVTGEALAERYRDHVLVGQYRGTRECHMEPDWLLVYERAEGEIVLVRTGSHSDLFK